MNNFSALIVFVSLICFFVFLVKGLIARKKLDVTSKVQFKRMGYSAIVFIAFFILFVATLPEPSTTSSTKTAAPKVEEPKQTAAEKAAAEAKAKQEAEDKARLEAERKATEEVAARAEEEKKAQEEAAAKAKAEQEAAAKKANAQPINFAQLEKNPDAYKGQYVKYTGQIVQIQENGTLTHIRLSVTQDSYGWDHNDIIYVEYAGSTNFVEKDVVTVYGTIYGSYTYTSQAGWNISLPAVIADSVEK